MFSEAPRDHRSVLSAVVLLKLHNVREVAYPVPWNVGFLAASAVLLAAGLVLARRREPDRGCPLSRAGRQ